MAVESNCIPRSLFVDMKLLESYPRRAAICSSIQYFIDFYVYSSRNELIGIQLKPETFYMGRYQYKVDIRGKMNAFCRDKNARAFILKYSVASDRSGIIFTNPEVINEIQTYL